VALILLLLAALATDASPSNVTATAATSPQGVVFLTLLNVPSSATSATVTVSQGAVVYSPQTFAVTAGQSLLTVTRYDGVHSFGTGVYTLSVALLSGTTTIATAPITSASVQVTAARVGVAATNDDAKGAINVVWEDYAPPAGATSVEAVVYTDATTPVGSGGSTLAAAGTPGQYDVFALDAQRSLAAAQTYVVELRWSGSTGYVSSSYSNAVTFGDIFDATATLSAGLNVVAFTDVPLNADVLRVGASDGATSWGPADIDATLLDPSGAGSFALATPAAAAALSLTLTPRHVQEKKSARQVLLQTSCTATAAAVAAAAPLGPITFSWAAVPAGARKFVGYVRMDGDAPYDTWVVAASALRVVAPTFGGAAMPSSRFDVWGVWLGELGVVVQVDLMAPVYT